MISIGAGFPLGYEEPMETFKAKLEPIYADGTRYHAIMLEEMNYLIITETGKPQVIECNEIEEIDRDSIDSYIIESTEKAKKNFLLSIYSTFAGDKKSYKLVIPEGRILK